MSVPSSSNQLCDILQRNAPSAHWIRGFLGTYLGDHVVLTELPDPAVSISAYAQQATDALSRHGLIDEALLSELERALPHEASQINDIRRTLGLPLRLETPVTFDLLTDNWVYQDIAELFAHGPGEDEWLAVQVGDRLEWTSLCWTGVALESLLSTLGAIVLRDRFLVEQKYIAAWTATSSPVLGLHAGRILCPIPEPDGLQKLRTKFYREFFHVPALQHWHAENSIAMRETGSANNVYASLVLWGSIGYLARSALLGVTYVGHPVRRGFLAQTSLVNRDEDAAARALTTVDTVRMRYLAAAEDATTRVLRYIVPPLLVEILEHSATCADLVPVALQFRDEYKKLRQWLAHFQRALQEGDRIRIRECEATLATIGASSRGPHACSVNYEVASRTVQSLAGLHRPAAMLLERLGRTKSGEDAIDRLLDLFDISGSALELPVLTHLRTSVMTKDRE
jgi:hypothetical protein